MLGGHLSLSERVEVVPLVSNSGGAQKQQWDVWIADMTRFAREGAIADGQCEAWLENVHVASSSAEAVRTVIHVEEQELEEEDEDFEPVYFFYLRSEMDGAQQGCMQVRIVQNVAKIDALCSLGNHGGEAFMRHLFDWLPIAAPDVVRVEVLPLSNGWLRQEYYKDLGFTDSADGHAMTRQVGRPGELAVCGAGGETRGVPPPYAYSCRASSASVRGACGVTSDIDAVVRSEGEGLARALLTPANP
jgi:hypothetical protein